jgi:signal transduction histidine kinase
MQRRLRRQEGRERELSDLARMEYQVQRLHHQLDIVMDAARLAEGGLTFEPVPGDLVAILERVAAGQQPASERHCVVLEPPDEPLVGVWDHALVEHAVHALLANAVRYSPRGGEIRVRGRKAGTCARVEVEDEGIGVPENERTVIFDFGRRASNMERGAGAGLGLYVAHGIITRQGGSIGMEPRPGGGSLFWFTLPL